MNNGTDPIVETIVAVGIIAVCGVVLAESLTIPHTAFDPLGSARVPQTVAVAILVLSLGVLVLAAGGLRGRTDRVLPSVRRSIDALVVLVLSGLFVVAMEADLLSFDWLGTIYLTLTIGWLERFSPRRMPLILGLALLVGFGSAYVFTKVFVVNLPGL